jgi:hypothetical protein
MLANLLAAAIGLWLSSAAIFEAGAGRHQGWPIAAAAAAIAALALAVRRSEQGSWQSSTNAVLGAVLLVLALFNLGIAVAPLVMFWAELWIGLAVASLALWAVLHHPSGGAAGEQRAQ